MGESFAQEHQIVPAFLPVDLQTAANDGDWVSLKWYHAAAVCFVSAVGTAGDDPTLTIEQATDVAGTGAKALNFTTIYTKQAATDWTGTGQYTRVTQTAANTYTDTDAAEQVALWIVSFEASELDVQNNFDCIRGRVADVGANAQLGFMWYNLYRPREARQILASAIVD